MSCRRSRSICLGWGFATNGKKTQAEQQLTAATNEASEAKGQASSLQTTNAEMLAMIGGPNGWNEAKDPLMKAITSQGVGNAKVTVLSRSTPCGRPSMPQTRKSLI